MFCLNLSCKRYEGSKTLMVVDDRPNPVRDVVLIKVVNPLKIDVCLLCKVSWC